MRYQLMYTSDSNIGGSIEYINFYGEGSVFMQDTMLVFKGNMPKFNGWALLSIYPNLFSIPTSRTVPYSTILKYDKPSFISGFHSIIYRLPDEKKCKIKFKIQKPTKESSQEFTVKLKEYLAVASAFGSSFRMN